MNVCAQATKGLALSKQDVSRVGRSDSSKFCFVHPSARPLHAPPALTTGSAQGRDPFLEGGRVVVPYVTWGWRSKSPGEQQ